MRRGERVKRYHYRESGLDNVYLEGGFEIVKSPYGEGVAIEDLEGLHRAIAQCLIEKPAPLSGAEFRFLRTELDLSQEAMGALCGRNERTVRLWETREEPIEEPANLLVRHIYRERFDRSATYEGLYEQIRRFQALDKEIHELKLAITKKGWQVIGREEAA